MKEKATIIAIIGVVVLGVVYMITSGFTQQTIDPELIKQTITGLVGFASGAGVVAGGVAVNNALNKSETE